MRPYATYSSPYINELIIMCILLVSYIPTRYQNPMFSKPLLPPCFIWTLFGCAVTNPPHGMLKLPVPMVSNQGWGPILVQVVAREPRFVVPHDGLARILSRREHLLRFNPNNRAKLEVADNRRYHRQRFRQSFVHPCKPNAASTESLQAQRFSACSTTQVLVATDPDKADD